VNTGPGSIRSTMRFLARAGITKAREGERGGAMLTKPANQITLQQVYEAVNGHADEPLTPLTSDPHCVVGRNIGHVIEHIALGLGDVMRRQLALISIADVASKSKKETRKRDLVGKTDRRSEGAFAAEELGVRLG
jgi:DNA-binding IscR family transcriptional regulator